MDGTDAAEQQRQALVALAVAARENAYAPYSRYQVGAAILTTDGRIFSGCNVENASYGLSNCAERTAVFSAIAAGAREITAVAIATEDGGTPCGACRQVLAEFAPKNNEPLTVFLVNAFGELKNTLPLSDLFPHSFVLR